MFRNYCEPTMNAFVAAAASGREIELQNELEVLFNNHNANGNEPPPLGSRGVPARDCFTVTDGSRLRCRVSKRRAARLHPPRPKRRSIVQRRRSARRRQWRGGDARFASASGN